MDKKADSIIKVSMEKLKENSKMIPDIKEKIQNRYENLYDAFEDAVGSGPQVLEKTRIPSDWSKVLTEVARSKIKIHKAKRSAILELVSSKKNGIDIIIESLKKAKKIKKSKMTEIKIYTVGSPRYRIEVSASDYESAEELLKRAVDVTLTSINDAGGQGRMMS